MLSIFDKLSNDHVDWLLANSEIVRITQDQIVIEKGDPVTALYILTEGLLGIRLHDEQPEPFKVLGPGAILGEMSFVDDQCASATVYALERVEALQIARSSVEAKMEEDSEFAADFFRAIAWTLSDRLRSALDSSAVSAESSNQLLSGPAGTLVDAMNACKDHLTELDKRLVKGEEFTDQQFEELNQKFIGLQFKMNEIFGQIESPQERNLLGALAHREMYPYIHISENGDRWYAKPRGYAGDFMSIEMMYRNEPAGSGRLGVVMDRVMLEGFASRAVRNRRGLLADEIFRTVSSVEEKPARIMSMACGPARELHDVFTKLDTPGDIKSTLLDIDWQALSFVADWRDREKLTGHMDLLNENLIYLALGRRKLDLPPQDLVYSIGLIDYFEDKLVLKLINFVYDLLKPGGRIILGNFHPKNPTKEFMDYCLEWRLIHRSEDDMDRLYSESKFNSPCTNIRFEEQGINLFAECVKT
ncbi:MAG: cyclic nucleotide-binding domain-containing protein [Pseudomonadota bacterium]